MNRKIVLSVSMLLVAGTAAFWFSVMNRRESGESSSPAPRPASATPAANNAHELAMLAEQLKRKPAHTPVLFRMAEIERQVGRPANAIKYLREILKTEPANREALLELGRALYDSGDVPSALTETRRLVEADPKNVDALYNLGAIYANSNDIEQARRYWTRAVQAAPDSDSGKRARNGLAQIRTDSKADKPL
jgi:cellulose synthase operon protein C